jgi:carbamoyl-phosphate synthase large subunit
MRVLIAGIGGASLGTELLKCLQLAGGYAIHGCDVCARAYGHYAPGFERTFLVDGRSYVESVLDVCVRADIECIIPGGEEPLVLLAAAAERLREAGVRLAANSQSVIETFSDKAKTFTQLAELGFRTPETVSLAPGSTVPRLPLPCIVKPATGSGGSSFVFLAQSHEEALIYVEYLWRNQRSAVVQEYVEEDEGEFTVGVLSLADGRVVASTALRRVFDSKLSVLTRSESGLISTGYSQGHIDEFPTIRRLCERIATAADSCGPLNVQGRLRDGELLPFELNPRFSASTYLRAMAGFNEVDVFLRHLLRGEEPRPVVLRPGYYLRSLAETYVSSLVS